MPKKHLSDIATRHQVFLEGLKTNEAQDFSSIFADINKETVAIINELGEDISELNKRELNALLAQLRQANSDLLKQSTDSLWTNLTKLAGYEAGFEARSIVSAVGKQLTLKIPEMEAAFQAALAQPLSVNGQLLQGFINSYTSKQIEQINNLVRKAWGEGWTNQQLTQGVRGTKKLGYKDGIINTAKRNAEAVVRTAVQHVANASRMSTWEANSDVITAYRIVATLDSQTTQICRSMDGQEFPVGEGPIPPFHYGCRTTTAAVVDPSLGLGFLDKGATRSSVNGYVDAKETYYSWLQDQPENFQNEALGIERATLFRDGGLSAQEFSDLNLDRNFQPLTLEEMQKLEPAAFEKAGVNP